MSQSENIFNGKTIVVAGAAGFIPSNLSEYYLNKGAKVIGIDNFISGSESNIEILSKYENFNFYKQDLVTALPDLSNEKIDFIFSMASPASPIDFETVPIEIMRVNSEGVLRLLDLAKEKGARILHTSTSEVYGDPEVHPQSESYVGHVNPIGPRACYDESKRFAEALIMSYFRKFELDTRIVRIFNTYGPRMRANDGRVIPNFINDALKGKDLIVYGDGTQTRSFCYVSDQVDALNAVMCSNVNTPINCGNPDEYSILECGKIIVEVLKSDSKVICNNVLPKDDPKKRRPDITKLKSISDFNPSVSFEEGLKRTAEYFKKL